MDLKIMAGPFFVTGRTEEEFQQVKLAAHTAVAAGGTYFFGFPGPNLVAGILFNQGPHRTNLHTFTAEYTVRILEGLVVRGDYLYISPLIAEINGIVYLDLVAGLHASPALDTPGEITHNERIDRLHGIGHLCFQMLFRRHLITISQILQPAVTPGRTQFAALVLFLNTHLKFGPVVALAAPDCTVVVSRGEHQLDDQFPGFHNFYRFGIYNHTT